MAYLVETLEEHGWCSNTVFCASGGELASWCEQRGISYTTAHERFAVNPFFAKKLSKLAKKLDVDLVHVHDSHAHTFAVMANAFFRMGCRLIVSRRVDFPVSSSPLSRWKYNHSSVVKIVCVSKAIQQITGAAIHDQSRMTTVHSGIDLARFEESEKNGMLHHELGLEQSIPLVGNVAALAPHKDYKTFIQTAINLVEQGTNAHFVVVGSGPLKDEVNGWVEQSGIADRIHLLGFRKDLPDVLPELDVFLITSETEGLGTSILDAFACGVPVVATDAGGIPEIVIHNTTGFLGKVKQPEILAQGVKQMLEDQAFRKRCVEGAHEHLKQFTKTATAQKTLQVYRAATQE